LQLPDLAALMNAEPDRVAGAQSPAVRLAALDALRTLLACHAEARRRGQPLTADLDSTRLRTCLAAAVNALHEQTESDEAMVRSAAWALDVEPPLRRPVLAVVPREAGSPPDVPGDPVQCAARPGVLVWLLGPCKARPAWLALAGSGRLTILAGSRSQLACARPRGVMGVLVDVLVERTEEGPTPRVRVDGGAGWVQSLLSAEPSSGWHWVRPPKGFVALTADPDFDDLVAGWKAGLVGPAWADGAHTRLVAPLACVPKSVHASVVSPKPGVVPNQPKEDRHDR
jgi:hypothetical protein